VPCPTNAQQWHGTSDKNGILTIPHEVVQFETLVAISSYQGSATLGKELERAMGRIVLVKLFPKYESNELEKLLGHLKHPDRGVRLRAFQEIRTRGVKEEAVIQALTASLQDRDAIIRAAAAHAFRFTWASVKPPVTQLQELLNDPEATVRVSAVDALLTALDQNERAQVEPAMIPALLKCLGNRDRDVVYKAGTLLSAIGEPAVSGLMAALRDQREHVRSHAAFALQQIGPKARAAIEPLRELLSDPSAEVRERASLSIQAIAGK
jgi:HEAT repeat protein